MPRIPIQKFYMKTALNVAELSYAEKKKVGCVIVKDDTIISFGYNGTPPGYDNCCEDKVIDQALSVSFDLMSDGGIEGRYIGDITLKTKANVIHAEMNALGKLAQSTISGKDAEMYLTLAPCASCANGIISHGIKKVYYYELYRSDEGIKVLKDAGIDVVLLNEVY